MVWIRCSDKLHYTCTHIMDTCIMYTYIKVNVCPCMINLLHHKYMHRTHVSGSMIIDVCIIHTCLRVKNMSQQKVWVTQAGQFNICPLATTGQYNIRSVRPFVRSSVTEKYRIIDTCTIHTHMHQDQG